jgi:predicted ester cyclase
MRQTLFTVLAVSTICFAACGGGSSTTAPATDTTTKAPAMSKEERNINTVKHGMDAINAHDVDKMKQDMATNFTEYGDGSMPPVKGDSAWMMLKEWLTAFPDTKIENTVYTATGDYVMAFSDYSGTFKGDMMGIKATGKSCKYKDVDIFKMTDDGKVLEHHNIYPAGAIMMQCGVDMSKMSPPPSGKQEKKGKM